jgi:ankyrin repeat/SOCS box protein 8
VEILLQHGADLNAGDGNKDTPLHWASFKNNVACTKLLLQHGAEVDRRDFNCDTSLSWAARKGHIEIIRILLEYNAHTNIRNLCGDTPVMRAACIQAQGLNTDVDDACLELLLRAAGQFDLRNSKGELRSEIARDNKLREMLLPLCESPRPLHDLCRFSIRGCVGYRYLPNVLPKLPIPPRLQDFLLLKK